MLTPTGPMTAATGMGVGMGMASWFPIVFGVIAVIVVAVFAYVIYATIRSRRALRRAGQDPDTIQADLAARVMQSDLLRPAGRSTQERLAELDRLRSSGSITAEEHAAARARVLAE
ncbi:DUF2630 family protein [Microbacterium marinilacus]|nr:DUF2630 family protein [Microbacterium marinilacus]MBY0686993.1 DUF2630 family protein [Microbacterium marinilacus]